MILNYRLTHLATAAILLISPAIAHPFQGEDDTTNDYLIHAPRCGDGEQLERIEKQQVGRQLLKFPINVNLTPGKGLGPGWQCVPKGTGSRYAEGKGKNLIVWNIN